MKKSRLNSKANKTKSRDEIINYKKQRNLVVKLRNQNLNISTNMAQINMENLFG